MELRANVGKALCPWSGNGSCSLETEEDKVCWRECRILHQGIMGEETQKLMNYKVGRMR